MKSAARLASGRRSDLLVDADDAKETAAGRDAKCERALSRTQKGRCDNHPKKKERRISGR